MLIRAIVYAKTEEEALAKAEASFDKLVGHGDFDYHQTGDEMRERWGNVPTVARADSPEGKALIDEGLEATKEKPVRGPRPDPARPHVHDERGGLERREEAGEARAEVVASREAVADWSANLRRELGELAAKYCFKVHRHHGRDEDHVTLELAFPAGTAHVADAAAVSRHLCTVCGLECGVGRP